jgi:malonate decarboxylase delta subunit
VETLTFEFEATDPAERRAHVGVVGSGDLEVLLEPAAGNSAAVVVRTSVDGYRDVWTNVLERFFARHPVAASIEINDFGATPGVVALRLAQAVEEARQT